MPSPEMHPATDHRAEEPIDVVLEALGDIMETPPDAIDPTTVLTALGIDSYTAVRLRRSLFEDTDVDLELTDFLGDATAMSIAQRIGRARPAEDRISTSTPPAASENNERPTDSSFELARSSRHISSDVNRRFRSAA